MPFLPTRRRNNQPLPIEDKEEEQQELLTVDLNENVEKIKTIYQDCMDVVFRKFQMFADTDAVIIYINGLANIEEIHEHVLEPLMEHGWVDGNGMPPAEQLVDMKRFIEQRLPVSKVYRAQTVAQCIEHLAEGNAVLLVDGQSEGVALGLSKWEKRAIEEPVAESGIRGPREGFIESLETNLSLLRRRIRSPLLKAKAIALGKYTKTEVAVCYIEGVAAPALVAEIEQRLRRVELDGVLETGYIEEIIQDHPYSPFPQVLNTERPDVAVASLLEGRIVIVQDGTPFVLVMPVSFYSLMQSSEDYYQRSLISTLIRLLRYLFLLVSLLLPSAYIAILTFHQEMIPTTLLLTVAASRERVPFPAFVEALIMEIVFEALREAGVRLPKQAGAAVSIVGALVIGQAAVQAGLVSAPMIMVVALTGIASFMFPRFTAAIALRMLRFPMMILAGSLGLLGIMLGLLLILTHMASLRSLGVPYLSVHVPNAGHHMDDVLIRTPWWKANADSRVNERRSQQTAKE
ncbi:spore germination protein [Geobacillus vulcani]|uniref:spore germination protein n=1 Tax=Geobacillus vulcani TaxID=135517 RepID=UPI0009005CAB|nr:spore germination protein [Geobacillus vulcani]